jgi:alpha-L-arabinofuranosidase
MSKSLNALSVAFVLVCGAAGALAAVPATIDIDVNKPGVKIPPTFYGLMTEEINHSYDGGLFAELIQNRTFQDPLPPLTGQPRPPQDVPADPPIHWSLLQEGAGKASMHTDKTDPVNPALPISLRLDLGGDAAGGVAGVGNDGYWGIPIRPETKYLASFYAKAGGGFTGPVTASLLTDDGNVTVAKADSQPISGTWQKYTVELTTAHDAPTTAKARFVLSARGGGSIWFSLVSLFPPTYMDTPGGLRPDLMKLMADLHPAFIRLPGGNYLEGRSLADRFNWKQMIGPADQRPGHMSCWGYRSSDGFGLPQYLLWCKQLDAEPVLAVFAGYSLNGPKVNGQHVDPGPMLQPYVDEALQEIEYVNGSPDSEWGKRRAADGFIEPFALHYVEVGNEEWMDRSHSYGGRFAQFYDAIKAKYPDLKIIATAPVTTRTPDVYDDHYYFSPERMAFDWGHYDSPTSDAEKDHDSNRFANGHHNGAFDRSGPQFFIGEWATQEGNPTPDLNAALADAAFLMGLEKNSDIIPLECYAPLFVNVGAEDIAKGYPRAWQWRTNLIGYDALTAFGSPSYYAQAMFGQHKGDVVLPATLAIDPTVARRFAATEPAPHGAVGVGAWQTQVEYKDIVATSPEGHMLLTADLTKGTSAWQTTGGKWNVQDQVLRQSDADATTRALTGDPAWTDYTIRLKARKTGGTEGFLILFHAIDRQNFNQCNIGGWGNTRTQFEDHGHDQIQPESNFTVQTGQWYDLRLEVSGHHAKCFIDDKLICQATEQPMKTGTPLFASASFATASNEVIVKVVNFGADNIDATLNLRGAAQVTPTGRAIVLCGDPNDVNNVDEPTKVIPKEETLQDAAASFHRTFPRHSLTLLLLTATPQQ